MPIKKVKRITAWSYSRLTAWEECPFKAKMKFIEKVEEPEGPALARGRAMEDAIYGFLFPKHDGLLKKAKARLIKLPASGELFPEELDALKKIASGVLNNRELAFDREWRQCDWKDWDRVYVRIKMDLLWLSSLKAQFKEPTSKRDACLRVVDLKSGKIYEDKLDQLDLYLVAALKLEPGVLPMTADVAQAEMWYLDQGETRVATMMRHDLPKKLAAWDKRVAPMLADESFLPTPGWQCKRCYLSKTKGGPCVF